MIRKVIILHSSDITDGKAKLPQANQIDYGELAINFADGVETISIKNSQDEIVEFKSKDYFENKINDKQDNISDIETIRQNAALGATALQSIPSDYATTESVQEMINNAITYTLNTEI